MTALRKLLLGETRALPAGVALVLAVGIVLHELDEGWWRHAGGFVLLAGVVAALSASLGRRR